MKWGFAPPLRGPPLGAGPLDPPPMALRASGGAAAPAPPRGRVRIAGPRRPRTPRNNAGGCVPGPGATRAPPGPLGSSAALRRHQAVCAPVPPVGGPFFAHSAAPFAPGPLPLRGPLRRGAPGAASRARSGPWGPRFARRARPPGLPPRLRRSAACAPLRGSAGARWPRLVRAPASAPAAGSLFGRPCSAPPPPRPSAWPRRVPPAPSRFAGFGGGCLRPRGARGLWPRSGGCAPRGLAARPRLRGLAGASFVPLFVPWGSPLRPPAPPPPLGAPGGARPVAGLRPPSRLRRAGPPWGALLAPHS